MADILYSKLALQNNIIHFIQVKIFVKDKLPNLSCKYTFHVPTLNDNTQKQTKKSAHRILPFKSSANPRDPKKNTSYGNEVLPQDTTHLIEGQCYQRRGLCQDPAGNRTTQRPPDHCKETQTAVVWSCLPFIRPGQNHLARA